MWFDELDLIPTELVSDLYSHRMTQFPSFLFCFDKYTNKKISARVSIAMMKNRLCSSLFALTGCGVLLLFMFNIARKIEN